MSDQIPIQVRYPSGKTREFRPFTLASRVADDPDFSQDSLVAILSNNELRGLDESLYYNCSISPVYLSSPEGALVYRRSLSFLLAYASKQLFPDRRLIIGHSLGSGYYYHFEEACTVEEITRIEETMRALVRDDVLLERTFLSWQHAIDHCAKHGLWQAKKLIELHNEPRIAMVMCRGTVVDLWHGPICQRSSLLGTFALKPYQSGFILRFPLAGQATLPPFEANLAPVLFPVFQEYKRWAQILGISCVGDLNDSVHSNRIQELVQVAEFLQDKKVASIAEGIVARPAIRLVLIAGPSSSGKTTFCRRLALHLQVLGRTPVPVGMDDFYVDREATPLDEDGNKDFESVLALDLPRLNHDLMALLAGEEVQLPRYDFMSGTRKLGERIRLPETGILIMEGIHGLNPLLTEAIPADKKYRVYASSLTQLNLDDHNRIPTTDNRLLRRMVRDNRTRNITPIETLERWPLVRRGEERNIFPYQHHADAVFNSALDYELSALKVLAEPLLKSVKPDAPQYHEARRLIHFLRRFSAMPHKYIPSHSILREFIGDSVFHTG